MSHDCLYLNSKHHFPDHPYLSLNELSGFLQQLCSPSLHVTHIRMLIHPDEFQAFVLSTAMLAYLCDLLWSAGHREIRQKQRIQETLHSRACPGGTAPVGREVSWEMPHGQQRHSSHQPQATGRQMKPPSFCHLVPWHLHTQEHHVDSRVDSIARCLLGACPSGPG